MQKQVNGFSGAEYKSFLLFKKLKNIFMGQAEKFSFKEDKEFIEAYVDGSYEHSIKMYGSGVVILKIMKL